MTKVLVVHASRHGGSKGIAERIGEVLRKEGNEAAVVGATEANWVVGIDAFVIGSGVYMGQWLSEGIEFLRQNQTTLSRHPVWLFSSGPLRGSTKAKAGVDPVENALGPSEGPGSGGRKQLDALVAAIGPQDHRVFDGAFDPSDPPKALSERLVRWMPSAKSILPAGDFRDWQAIEAWAHEIAVALERAPVGVG
jgi:menaquinone-dependent protoporphyrinogen oxidase